MRVACSVRNATAWPASYHACALFDFVALVSQPDHGDSTSTGAAAAQA